MKWQSKKELNPWIQAEYNKLSDLYFVNLK